MLANKRGRFHPPQELENRRHGAASGRLSAGRTGRSSALPFRRGSDARADALLLQMISAAGEESWARVMLGVSGRAATTAHRSGRLGSESCHCCRLAEQRLDLLGHHACRGATAWATTKVISSLVFIRAGAASKLLVLQCSVRS